MENKEIAKRLRIYAKEVEDNYYSEDENGGTGGYHADDILKMEDLYNAASALEKEETSESGFNKHFVIVPVCGNCVNYNGSQGAAVCMECYNKSHFEKQTEL